MDVPSINNPVNRRNKRIFDLSMSVALQISAPLLCWFASNKPGFFRNIVAVISGRKSWVGRDPKKDTVFPGLKPGVLSPAVLGGDHADDKAVRERLNILYAKDFKVWNDLRMVISRLRKLGDQ